jgi:hypothetical protein
MRFEINGKEFTEEDLANWKRERIPKVLRNLHRSIQPSDSVETLSSELLAVKESMTYETIVSLIRRKLAIGTIGMKLAVRFSFGKRKAARTVIYADGIHVDKLGKIIDALMMEDREEYRTVNLSVCPDHYALIPRGKTLEIIETTGNTPVPTRFFITFNDETGLITPRDPSYPYQSTGIAKLENGTIIGGVRHQFRDTASGIEARTSVEFPAICPNGILQEHQKHLAAEWSGWIQWAIDHQNDPQFQNEDPANG